MRTFLDECVWIVLSAYLLILLLVDTAMGSPVACYSFDTLKVSSEQLKSLPSQDYPIYSVLLNRSRQIIVNSDEPDFLSGLIRQFTHDANLLLSSENWKQECFDLIPASIRSSHRRMNYNKGIPFHIVQFNF